MRIIYKILFYAVLEQMAFRKLITKSAKICIKLQNPFGLASVKPVAGKS